MPTVTRQQSRPPTTGIAPKSSANGQVAGESAWDMTAGLKVLTYGQSGVGKTTFWATFPGPILALICSGGNRPGELRSIDTPENRKKIRAETVLDVAAVKAAILTAPEYATVVLDHVSGLQDLILKEILGLSEIPAQKSWGLATQQQYGQCAMQAKEQLRALLSIEGNVVIVGQERTFGGRDDGMDPDLIKPTVGPAVIPSLAGWLAPACDFVLQMHKRPKMVRKTAKVGGKEIVTMERGKGIEYCARCEPHDIYLTKFRLPKGRQIPDVIIDPDYAKIKAVIDGR